MNEKNPEASFEDMVNSIRETLAKEEQKRQGKQAARELGSQRDMSSYMGPEPKASSDSGHSLREEAGQLFALEQAAETRDAIEDAVEARDLDDRKD